MQIISEILAREEGKTLEFKLDCSSLEPIVRTVIAFANTAGGQILIGIRDNSKELVGIEDPTQDESRLCNAFSDMISPQLIPDINVVSYRRLSLLLISVPHLSGPYYLKSVGLEGGTYIRLGSSNRAADSDMIEELRRQAQNMCFDETPLIGMNSEQIDFRVASELFAKQTKSIDIHKLINLGALQNIGSKVVPSIGGILLFGINKEDILPDARIKCARFKGTNSTEFLDNLETGSGLINAVDEVIEFIRRHTRQGLEIGATSHKVIPEYPEIALREAVINAIVHADYAIKGMSIRVGIYDDRIEISNPGSLPFGISMENIFSGISKLRNRVIGRVFHELRLIEQWGTGISRIKETCHIANLPEPRFEELGTSFRVTLYSGSTPRVSQRSWELKLVEYLQIHKEISSKQAADLWGISERGARMKLKTLTEEKIITKIATNPNDPKTVYILQAGI
jgi:predicted HTH transcriptional regulator